ncbi:UDP-4-amino-4,6-dideoxy-N-acetyl-beta-L-altrosamine N-acetyltransferase [Gottfriedia acidiceleris]|uniref:UDP-4-amino-4, 6-dideoxy-N-acetyl-beta-L-altrosamine N-acetyltransferase n=1 Tax=Gottfriedia acidiceleris TaxID=371036 RepID=UPI000B43748C|nr:UDP-4-amino-4,6-dideoxy-N-acetyl-beta-L-altrosamine N-acetyltransferase [Gottfriedia acidiceleris]
MIQIEDFKLIDLEHENLNIVLTWRNSHRVRSVMNSDEIITIDQHYRWFALFKNDQTKIAKLFLYKNKPIGFIQFTNINKKHGTCEWGFYIGEKTAPRGSGTVMGILTLDYLFNVLKMRKLNAHVLDINFISLNYHKKLGFVEEGRLEKQILKNNQYADLVLFGLFKESWNNKCEVLKKGVTCNSE